MLREATYGSNKGALGTFDTKEFLHNRSVLLIGSGPSIKKYKEPIEDYINKHQPYVISLNVNKEIDSKYIDVVCACHEARIMSDLDLYKDLDCNFLTPFSNTESLFSETISKDLIIDYGLSLEKNAFRVESHKCFLDAPIAAAYSLSFCIASSAKNISLVGFDGYEHIDTRQAQMVDMLSRYYSYNSNVDIFSLTPTNYNIKISPLFL